MATIHIEVTKGLFAFNIAGISGAERKALELKFCSALRHAGFPSPKTRLHKITITINSDEATVTNISLHESSVVVGYLCATRQISALDKDTCILGSIELGGKSVDTPTLYAAVRTALTLGFKSIFIPESGAERVRNFLSAEHFPSSDQKIFTYKDISHLITSLQDEMKRVLIQPNISEKYLSALETFLNGTVDSGFEKSTLSRANIRALLIACVGHHPLVLWGPPGQGKTAAIEHIRNFIPPLTPDVRSDIEYTHSMWGIEQSEYQLIPIAPHHTVTLNQFQHEKKLCVSSQACGHTLILDEFIDFKLDVIRSMRKVFDAPIHGGLATLIIAACNPCPCGKYGTDHPCTCSPAARDRYVHKVPDSVWDRFHIYSKTQLRSLKQERGAEKFNIKRVYECALGRQSMLGLSAWQNGKISFEEIPAVLEKTFSADAAAMVSNRTAQFLSVRKQQQVVTVARTIADVSDAAIVQSEHVLEALSLVTAVPFKMG